tara:strand:+ start:1385 stop:1597 length:213 start_codon:yes stop_codon:yes gene_type:complete
MEAKEKAKELVDRFCKAKLNNGIIGIYQPLAKQCALICVDEILESYNTLIYYPEDLKEYWKEIKQEISKL